MRTIQLQYPDQTSDAKIVDDLTLISRASGPSTLRGAAAFSDTVLPGVRAKLAQRLVPLSGAVVPEPLPATQAIVDNGGTVPVRNSAGADSHNATAVVAAGELSGVNLAATVAMVDNSDAITVQNSAGAAVAGTHAATVAAGVLSNVRLAATVAPVVNSAAVTVLPAAGTTPAQGGATAVVAAGALTGVRLPATSAVVTNGQVIAVAGGTVTLTVAANAVTAVFTAA